ncbi:hypothetical protein NQ315_012488 [Exocentrus adspersus]|uniref:DDE Tnp4 domain-containing protein n=1 Tax=Exocentrus adspersus TaxID=1586481 RepID=A0AAV8VC51_9CUCU|nr:hypothetical protein NQ315_012488 [Exocentrus adspersus]
MSDIGDSDISDSETSEEDEQLIIMQEMKNQNYLEEVVPEYSNEVFFEHFRLSREVVNTIAERYEDTPELHSDSGPYGDIGALNQVLIYLWYIGHQTASFRDVGDRFNVTISTVHRIIRRLIYFLSNLSSEIILWPNDDGKRISEEHFSQKGFPNVIGAIDGCHIKIDKPQNDPDSYINRKGYYSIQRVCDHRRKILDVFIGYPGSVHDSRVFRNSPLQNSLDMKCGRYVIEHCFGILKQKFRQLYHLKLRNIHLIVHFIRAACVLHNIALDDEVNIGNEARGQDNLDIVVQLANDENDDIEHDEAEDIGARAIRDRIANTLPMCQFCSCIFHTNL